MGLKKLFRPPKEMDNKDSKDFLQKNGVVVKDSANYHKKKFKFGEFGKFAEQQAANQDTTLRPVMPNIQTGYGSYDNDTNQSDSNQGYGYDEYANDFKSSSQSKSQSQPQSQYSNYGNMYNDSRNNSYSYNGSDNGYARDTKRTARETAQDQRRQKVNNYASTSNSTTDYSYQPEPQPSTNYKSDDGYKYEPSINSYSNSNGYGFDPYADTAVISKSTTRNTNNEYTNKLTKTQTTNTNVTQSTYDPYAPGEEPYTDDAGAGADAASDVYGSYMNNNNNNINDHNYNSNNINDSATIAGQTMDGLADEMQAVQLQKEQSIVGDVDTYQNQDFDPYGPSAEVQTQAGTELDVNDYAPTQDQYGQSNYVPYDGDEFEEEFDEDEEELNRIQRQTKDVREDTVNLSRTLVDNLGQANNTATNTLGVLGNQREKIYEMENNIGTMKIQQRFVDDHVKDLEHYNRSLFHIKVSNPFTRNSRRRAKDAEFLAHRQEDRANKDRLNSDLYQSQRAIMDQLKNDNVKSELQEKYDYDRRVKEASKYLTKDHDEEDERMEVEIAANVEHAQKLAKNLKKKAMLMNKEIDQQNTDLKKVSENVDYMDDKIVMTTRRIRGI